MVHALQETWRVTRSAVLDVRPIVGEPQVIVRDRNGSETVCGGLRWDSPDPEGHPEADAALAQALAEGWFAVAASRQFDWVDVFKSADELAETIHEEWERDMDEETTLRLMRGMRQAGRGAEAVIRQAIRIQLLRKV
jgi:hypothetical protein